MDYCSECGHELGVGRYCTNCGHPVDASWRTDTAERAPIPADPGPGRAAGTPPPAWTPPAPVRYPLYADEVGATAPQEPRQQPHDAPEHTEIFELPEEAGPAGPASHRRRPWGLWAAGAAVLALVAIVGVVLLTGGDDDEPAGTADGKTADASPGGQQGGGVANLARDARVTVPATAAPGADVNGKPVSFEAENMLDGVPETAWRMPGDGTGDEIVITLARESRLRQVGLINGYAKKAAGRDWYHGNRRINQVQWVFDDGTTVDQDLDDTTGVQSVDADVTTTSITLRLVAVSEPGRGPDRRDNTAISDLSIVGGR